jgi:protein TonB
MTRADITSPRGTRLATALAVAALHGALVLVLIRAFAPDIAAQVVDRVSTALTVTISAPPPRPPQPPRPRPAAAAAEAGRRAVATPVAAPSPPIVLASQAAAAPVAGQGSDHSAGARAAGTGTGAGGAGAGAGTGGTGTGQGGGAVRKAVKIAGDISSARDYPPATREARLGDYVIVALTVGVDGRVRHCRVHRPSRDPQSDQVTCRLATERFRFRPATDSAGQPVESIYGWEQRWFDPREKKRQALEPPSKSGI